MITYHRDALESRESYIGDVKREESGSDQRLCIHRHSIVILLTSSILLQLSYGVQKNQTLEF
jgi:hypothetical protein